MERNLYSACNMEVNQYNVETSFNLLYVCCLCSNMQQNLFKGQSSSLTAVVFMIMCVATHRKSVTEP